MQLDYEPLDPAYNDFGGVEAHEELRDLPHYLLIQIQTRSKHRNAHVVVAEVLREFQIQWHLDQESHVFQEALLVQRGRVLQQHRVTRDEKVQLLVVQRLHIDVSARHEDSETQVLIAKGRIQ